MAIAFGPVASRRLGRSLGINHVPPKHCTYDCAYCQVGRTPEREREPRTFFPPAEVADAVRRHLFAVRATGGDADWLTFVPDGEPTLDAGLGEAIDLLRPLGVPIAVITNGSLLSRAEVRATLARADLVSVKVDAVRPAAWRRVNRPHPELDLDVILDGMRVFAASFRGRLITETMLVDGANDGPDDLEATAAFVGALRPATAYLGVPTRPPSEAWARGPDEPSVLDAWEVFARHVPRVELLVGDPVAAAGVTGDLEADLLAITAVHPLRQEEVDRMVQDSGADPGIVERLVAEGRLRRVPHRGITFYVPPRGP